MVIGQLDRHPLRAPAVPAQDPAWDYKVGQADLAGKNHMTHFLVSGMKNVSSSLSIMKKKRGN